MKALYRSVIVWAMLGTSCLPKDTRPPPGELHVDAVADDLITNGVVGADGWTISYQRFLVSVGRASLEGDFCIAYSDLNYSRVLDMKLDDRQKLNLVYGSGSCEVDFELSSPWDDSVLGTGVSAADRDFMRIPGSDQYVKDGGISIHVIGSAENGASVKQFAWSYRRRIDYSTCFVDVNGESVSEVELAENAAVNIDITMHGGTLFQDRLQAQSAAFGFADFAAADDTYGNADGSVTLEELGQVPLADIAGTDHYADAASSWKTLADYAYQGLFSRVVQYRDTGICEQEVFPNDRTGH